MDRKSLYNKQATFSLFTKTTLFLIHHPGTSTEQKKLYLRHIHYDAK